MVDEKQVAKAEGVAKEVDDVAKIATEEAKKAPAAVTKKTTKKVAKKATKKVAKKATKKVAKKTAAKKSAKKVTKKTAKKVSEKNTSEKKTAKKKTEKVKKKSSASKKTSKKEAKKAKKLEKRIAQLQAMLQDNLSGLSGDKAEAMAKNIWLAGLGAYSKTYEELSERYDDVQDKYEEINAEGQKIFGDLVGRGQTVQNGLESKVSKGRETLEDRVDEIKNRFGGGLSSFIDIPERLRDAAEKIEEISVKLRKKK